MYCWNVNSLFLDISFQISVLMNFNVRHTMLLCFCYHTKQNLNCLFLQNYNVIQFQYIGVTPYHVTVVDVWKNKE